MAETPFSKSDMVVIGDGISFVIDRV